MSVPDNGRVVVLLKNTSFSPDNDSVSRHFLLHVCRVTVTSEYHEVSPVVKSV